LGVRVRAVILGAAIAAVAATGVTGQQGRFRAEVDLVTIAVMVMDRQGNFISDLKPDDFALYEDGARQQVTHFLRGNSDAEALNLRLGLLLDTSGSMQADIALARTAAIRFLRELPEAHDVTLVDFDTEVRVARYGLADLPRLIERIRTRRTAGWTAFYDALGIYLDGVQELDGRKILVVYTDGGDTRSAQTFSDVLEMLKASDVIVYGIGFLQHQPTSVRNEQKLRLQQLADVTGGQTFFPTSAKGLGQVFDQIVAQVRAQYSLGFISSNASHDGSWRKVEVRLTPTHLQALRLRARRGYYAPLKDVPPTAILGGAPRGRE
jgi:Ca-activated chloride channel family protein